MLAEEKKYTTADATTTTDTTSGGTADTTATKTTYSSADNTSAQSAGTSGTANTSTGSASAYNTAMSNLTGQSSTPQFSSGYDSQISDLYNQITNREKFSYDYSTDPLYNQYKEQYTQGGKQAMIDTQGQAAALTGGYGSSYGQAVGQQAYDSYLSKLNDVMPELYSNAYNYYQDESDRLNQQYQLANDMRNTEYSQFRDAVGDKQYADALAIQQANDRAALGDWSGYAQIYGEDAAKIAAILQNPQAAYAQGMATADEIYKLTGTRVKTGTGKSSSSNYGGWSKALQEQIDAAHEQGGLWAPGW